MEKEFMNINQKKILFISPRTFNYEIEIIKELEEMGAEIDFYNESSISNKFFKILYKLFPSLFYFESLKYYNFIIKLNSPKKYDFIFFIKANMISSKSLKSMRNKFKNAQFILYLWDSIENNKGIIKKFKYFDKLFTFDFKDSLKFPSTLTFLPLFYLKEFSKICVNNQKEKKYDITFIGTNHSNRYSIINKLITINKDFNLNLFIYLYFQTRIQLYFFKLTHIFSKKSKILFFSNTKLSFDEIIKIYGFSNAILDIEHPKQDGLTIRTIETIGMNKKLITTNENILTMDFYHPNKVFILTQSNYKEIYRFLKLSDFDYPLRDKYSLKNFLRRIFDV
jgi:hypothetical protein